MPTERFFRLPKEKAETIRQAAIVEFKRVSPEEASINKIIQNADISRGSFYTYFQDKYDLLQWLMEDGIKSYQSFYLTELQKNGGDIWDVFDRVFEDTIRWALEEGLIEIVKNMLNSGFFRTMFPGGQRNCPPERARKDALEYLYPYVNQKICPISPEAFSDLMEMHAMSLMLSVKEFLLENHSLEKVTPSYQRRNKLLRYGVCPRPEQTERN